MTPLDLKRLITGFLVLAISASSIALVFTGLYSGPDSIEEIVEASKSEHLKLSKNAFEEPLPDTIATVEGDSPLPAISPANLTDNLAYTIADGVLKTNPLGPSQVAGQVGIDAPGLNLLVNRFAADPKVLSQAMSEQQAVESSKSDIKVLENYTNEDLQKYLTAVNAIVARRINQNVQKVLVKEPSLEAGEAVESSIGQIIKDLKGVQVPKKFVDLHSNFVAILISSRDSLVPNTGSEDPLRELVAVEMRLTRLEELQKNFEENIKDLESLDLSFGEIPETNFLLGLFSVKTAHATIPTIDWAHIGTTILHWVISFAKSVARSLLKDQLIHRLVNQTVKWIQGGGKPQFVTDWKGFLKSAVSNAAGEELYKISPRLCQSFGPLIQLSLQPVTIQDSPVRCTLDRVVRNVKDFYDSFNKGGWIAYGASIGAGGNFFGSLIQANDILIREKATAAAAAKSNAEASEGFLSTEICVKSRIINEFKDCLDTIQEQGGDPAECNQYPNVDKKICEKSDVTTPGAALGHTIYDALGAPIQRIVNSDDVTALVSALINAALNKLIALGNSGKNKGIAGLNVDGGNTTPPGGDPLAECQKISDPAARAACIQQICSVMPDPKPTACTAPPEGGKCGPEAEAMGCRCTGPGGQPGLPPNDLSASDFEFTGQAGAAQERVAAAAAQECGAGGNNTKGLDCSQSPNFTSVLDAEAYTGAVAAEVTAGAGGGLRGGMVQGDEVGVANSSKSEHFDIVSSLGIWINEIAICTPPSSPPF